MNNLDSKWYCVKEQTPNVGETVIMYNEAVGYSLWDYNDGDFDDFDEWTFWKSFEKIDLDAIYGNK